MHILGWIETVVLRFILLLFFFTNFPWLYSEVAQWQCEIPATDCQAEYAAVTPKTSVAPLLSPSPSSSSHRHPPPSLQQSCLGGAAGVSQELPDKVPSPSHTQTCMLVTEHCSNRIPLLWSWHAWSGKHLWDGVSSYMFSCLWVCNINQCSLNCIQVTHDQNRNNTKWRQFKRRKQRCLLVILNLFQ